MSSKWFLTTILRLGSRWIPVGGMNEGHPEGGLVQAVLALFRTRLNVSLCHLVVVLALSPGTVFSI